MTSNVKHAYPVLAYTAETHLNKFQSFSANKWIRNVVKLPSVTSTVILHEEISTKSVRMYNSNVAMQFYRPVQNFEFTPPARLEFATSDF
jgi:hypothetical protein